MRAYAALLLILIAVSSAVAAEGAKPVVVTPISPQEYAEDLKLKPEEVLRRFLIALLNKDRRTLLRYMLPAEGADTLWEGRQPDDKKQAEVRARFAEMKFKTLKPGDKVKSAEGKEYTITDTQVNVNRMLILPEGFSLPIALVWQRDGWKVRAQPLIAARKIEEEAESKEKAATPQK